MSKQNNTVQVTTNYDKFTFVNENRDISRIHVNELKESLRTRNLTKENPILVTKDMVVIDGQHRLKALKQLNLPVYYSIVDDYKVEDIVLLNRYQKKWEAWDYVKYYALNGLPDYQRLDEVYHHVNADPRKAKNSFRPTNLISHTSLVGLIQPYGVGKVIREGALKFSEQDKESLIKFFDYVETQFAFFMYRHETRFLRALVQLLRRKDVDKTVLETQISQHPELFRRQPDINTYFNMLAKIYNMGRGRRDTSKIMVAPK